jgi:hypothetical protein
MKELIDYFWNASIGDFIKGVLLAGCILAIIIDMCRKD